MKRFNVLLLLPDQHRGDWMPYRKEVFKTYGMEPLPIRMPNVSKLMEEGMVFTNAITPSPLCAPARACLAAGLRYEDCGVIDNGQDYPLQQKTFYRVFKDHGYHVGGVGKFDLNKQTPWWGLDGWRDELSDLGFTHAVDNAGKMDAVRFGAEEPKDPYMNALHDRGLAKVHAQDMIGRHDKTHPTPLPDDLYCDNWLTEHGVTMLRNFPKDEPWFMQVNFTGPHDPWDVTSSMKERWMGTDFPEPNQPSAEDHNRIDIRRNYAAMLENIDRNIGLLLEEVRKRGEWERTIIVYSSDHGELLGDFGKYGKSSPKRASVHIPLVILGPGIRRQVHSEALVELQDLSVTLLHLVGLDMPEATGAVSFAPVLWGGTSSHRIYQRSALTTDGQSWRCLSDGTYKVIHYAGQSPELYHLPSDPWEHHNIADEHNDKLQSLLLAMG